VGVLMLRPDEDCLFVDTLLLSCRALGRGVEHRMIAYAGQLAHQQGKQGLKLGFTQSARNVPIKRFLDENFNQKTVYSDGAVYTLNAKEAAAVKLSTDAGVGHSADKRPSANDELADTSGAWARIDFEKIAKQLNTAEKISALCESMAVSRIRPDLSVLYVAPVTPLEKSLAAIWSCVLGIEKIGTDDNFFDLGGTSLKAVQLIARCKQDLSLALPVATVFGSPTIKAVVCELENASDAGEPLPSKKRVRSGYKRRRRA
ncbi:phosphopantetheine-binding protein, partial [Granulosicoccus sp.]|nr:phosphopantetheine-binding protein [Granulosicoccus sp.]